MKKSIFLFILLLFTVLLVSCGNGESVSTSTSPKTTVQATTPEAITTEKPLDTTTLSPITTEKPSVETPTTYAYSYVLTDIGCNKFSGEPCECTQKHTYFNPELPEPNENLFSTYGKNIGIPQLDSFDFFGEKREVEFWISSSGFPLYPKGYSTVSHFQTKRKEERSAWVYVRQDTLKPVRIRLSYNDLFKDVDIHNQAQAVPHITSLLSYYANLEGYTLFV